MVRYAALSAALFAVDTILYVLLFLVARPQYTFLFGNWLLIALLTFEGALAFYMTCARKRREPDVAAFRHLASCVCTGLLLLYGLHATVFTIVERSVSMNVLRFLATGQSEPYDRIEKNFVETFVYRDRAVCKRLDEQVHLGNVSVDRGRYALTAKGARTFAILESAGHVTADKDPKNAVSCSSVGGSPAAAAANVGRSPTWAAANVGRSPTGAAANDDDE
jgi:hypothetical protein